MSQEDMATDIQTEDFLDQKVQILSEASTWEFESKKYLEAVLNALEVMTAYYSYGNGEISIENNQNWQTLDSKTVIPMLNHVIHPYLGIKVYDIQKFPRSLWFEIED